MTDAYIHLRVPAGTKARWVRESREQGLRLTDWITRRVDTRTAQDIGKMDLNAAEDPHGAPTDDES